MITKEFCAENLTDLHRLTSPDITRVELCDNLAVGGTTPSYGVIKEANRYLHEKKITTAIMIRPRGGNFIYNDLELRAMEEDILQAVELESDALVLGLLTEDNQLDKDAIEQLLPSTQGLPLVFHMAFDQIPQEDQFQAMDDLIDYGFTRILTHGNPDGKSDIFNNLTHLKALIEHAADRIEILIGGGVTKDNFEELVKLTGAKQVHGTRLLS
ncbi:copper homeostasis protein CutC [Streptococcus halotolerans]|uniref:copper homeostasis protein CutC n=1 Tax=Streptococcus halotolerans TaxID=1814128 RepID=UPI0007898232|nr:copper homeostasis protein CutC [Streptococcus halotolerans]